ncbi:MAG: AbrB/MazE/SpoVT family DNA-binding domain-containing protein [Ruminococcaceae bacterium]|nr:AbrB/MazE/SpoVT family DNA-binding domain-containing protein [Oscillospiraceae bacterium]
MKATGIVRRIDDLGRVVIPKEIRRTMRIREGDPLEIYTDREGEVIFKKYSPIGELAGFATEYAETLHKVCGISVLIFDRDAVIASAGVPRREYVDKKMSEELEEISERRQLFVRKSKQERVFAVIDGGDHYLNCAMPIITEGDMIGCVCTVTSDEEQENPAISVESEAKLIQTAATFLSKQMES